MRGKIIHLSKQLKALRLENENLRKKNTKLQQELTALWCHELTDNWAICLEDFTLHDLHEELDERYAFHPHGWIILKEKYVQTTCGDWLRKEEKK